jgi:predicted GTPase
VHAKMKTPPKLAKYNELVRLLRNVDFQRELEEALSNPFVVLVMGAMKSGKSTLINALLGQDLLPTATISSTATIFKIEDCDTNKGFHCRPGDTGEWQEASRAVLEQWNDSSLYTRVEIKGNLPYVRNEGARLVLYDTPGPNNAVQKKHGELTRAILARSEHALILYMLATTQMESDDEAKLLNLLKSSLNGNPRSKKRRVVFVMNRVDEFDEEKPDQSIAAALKKQKQFLIEMGFIDPVIVPTIARDALLIRGLCARKELSEEEQDVLECRLKKLEKRRTSLVRTTECSQYVKDIIYKGLKGIGHAPYCALHLTGSNAAPVQSIDNVRLIKSLFCTGIPSLEACLEEMLIKEALPKTMIKVESVFRKYGASKLLKWCMNDSM